MELVNEFSVDAPADRVWATVGDLEQVAQCLPGASIDEVDGDEYRGRVLVKVGPISLGLAGTARILDRDDADRRMVVQGEARDRHGQGSAAARISVSAVEAGGRTDVRVVTDVDLGGRIAQFGAGMISQVSDRIVKQFVRRLEALIETPDGITAPSPGRAAPDRAIDRPVAALLPAAAVVALAGALFGWALGRALRSAAGAH
ncbi:MAG: SRPBCC family protein [Propionibacteriaceae bacterium]